MESVLSAERNSKILQEISMFCLCSYHHRSQIHWFLCSKYILITLCVPGGQSWVFPKSSTFPDVLLPSIHHLQPPLKQVVYDRCSKFCLHQNARRFLHVCALLQLKTFPSIYSSSAIQHILPCQTSFCSGSKCAQGEIMFLSSVSEHYILRSCIWPLRGNLETISSVSPPKSDSKSLGS